MTIYQALYTYLITDLTALSPSVPIHYGKVPVGITEWLEISDVTHPIDVNEDEGRAVIQFTAVTRASMLRADEILTAVYNTLQRFSGTMSGYKVTAAYLDQRPVPSPSPDEFIKSADYRVNYA